MKFNNIEISFKQYLNTYHIGELTSEIFTTIEKYGELNGFCMDELEASSKSKTYLKNKKTKKG